MPVWVVLLRGINVGGHRKVPMATLRDAYREVGCDPVLTYIQSGNVVVGSAERDAGALAASLHTAVAEACGVDADLVLRTAGEWQAIRAADPFGAGGADRHVAALLGPPPEGLAAALEGLAGDARVALLDREVHWHLPGGVTPHAKVLARAERLCGPTTMRNWRTVERLAAMVEEAGST